MIKFVYQQCINCVLVMNICTYMCQDINYYNFIYEIYFQLFNTLHKKVEKKRKRPDRTKSSTPTETIRLHLTCAELLSYEKILPGLVALGCIRNITPYTIEVELPGRTFVKVEINAITDILSARLLDEANNSSEVNIVDNVTHLRSNYTF